MKFPFFIAYRYLLAKKSHQAINIITWISVAGVAIGTMALVIVLSVFNGFEQVISNLFNAFNPDLIIKQKNEQVFSLDELPLDQIRNIPGIAIYSEVLEESALITHQGRQHLLTMRGVDGKYAEVTGIDTMLVEGDFILESGDSDFFVIGEGVEYVLAANIHNFMDPFHLYVPRRGRTPGLHPSQAFNASTHFASGVFRVHAETDMEFVLVPLRLARKMLNFDNEVNMIVIGLTQDANPQTVQSKLAEMVGPDFRVLNRFQQQEFLYRIMRTEKWAIFFILTFILIIASFNVIGSLTMLVIEKSRDIRVLHNLGASQKLIRRIFLIQGILISLGGAFAGIFIGTLISWIQMQFGVITLQAEGTFIIDAYPVLIKASDLLKIAFTVFGIGLIASLLPLRNISMLLQSK